MSGAPKPRPFFDAEQDRRLRSYGLRAWAWIGILTLAAMLYTGFSLVSGFVIPLIVAIVLGMVFEPVANVLSRVMPRQVASLLVLVGLGVLAAFAVVIVGLGIIDQGPEIDRSAPERRRSSCVPGSWSEASTSGPARICERSSPGGSTKSCPGCCPMCRMPSRASPASSRARSSRCSSCTSSSPNGRRCRPGSARTWAFPRNLGQGIVEDATRSFRDYFYVLTLSSLPVALVVGAAAWVMGIPLAFTIALITFITSYVPYLGALVSSVFALLIAFGSGGPLDAIIILIVILLAQNVIQPIIQRQLERNALDLHPIVSFGSTIIGSVFFGILGATLSAPTVAMVLRVNTRIKAFQAGAMSEADIEGMIDPADARVDPVPDGSAGADAAASSRPGHSDGP